MARYLVNIFCSCTEVQKNRYRNSFITQTATIQHLNFLWKILRKIQTCVVGILTDTITYILDLAIGTYKIKYSRMDQVKFMEDRQPLKNLKGYGLLKQTTSLQIF